MGRGGGAELAGRTRRSLAWPRAAASRLEDPDHAAELAWEVRNLIVHRGGRLSDLERVCELAGCELTRRALRGKEGGLHGLLIPRSPESFEIVVDEEPPGGWDQVGPWLRPALARHRRRFLIAHELAHTLLWEWSGNQPRRRAPDGPIQERFCDEFARALLVPPSLIDHLEPTPASVLTVQRRFDISLQVATRAMAGVHGQRAFFALLLVHPKESPDLTRPQWRPEGQGPDGRWWTGPLVAEALGPGQASGCLTWEGRTAPATALHRRRRQQVVLVAERPRLASA